MIKFFTKLDNQSDNRTTLIKINLKVSIAIKSYSNKLKFFQLNNSI
jgi:hypothetical protein